MNFSDLAGKSQNQINYDGQMQYIAQQQAMAANAAAQRSAYGSDDKQLREKALAYALQAASFTVDPLNVVETAESYLTFLLGDTDKQGSK